MRMYEKICDRCGDETRRQNDGEWLTVRVNTEERDLCQPCRVLWEKFWSAE